LIYLIFYFFREAKKKDIIISLQCPSYFLSLSQYFLTPFAKSNPPSTPIRAAAAGLTEFVEYNQMDVPVFLFHIVVQLYHVQYNFPVDYQLNY
jgi:hypothetical protein